MLKISEYRMPLLTHRLIPAGPIPTVQKADSCYPYETFCETARRPELRYYRFVTLENDRLAVTICPDLGGKVYSLIHKGSGKNVLVTEPIVRPIRILPRQFYIGGGIEVSFPISHSPVQMVPLCCRVMERDGRIFCCCGEREIKFGMYFTVEYSLGEKDAFLTQRTQFVNPTGQAHPWMSWSNAGVPARPDTELHYPKGEVLEHGCELRMIDWEKQGPRTQRDIPVMTGWFWRKPACNAFGAYTPSLGAGLYHVADPEQVPGIKLWSDGVGGHTAFVTQWTLSGGQCLEIQAGPLVDQGVKNLLQPGQRQCHTEFWIPTDKPLEIDLLQVPQVALPPQSEIPLFAYARPEETEIWQQVMDAFARNDRGLLPQLPGLDSNCWPPTGLEGLADALHWAAGDGNSGGGWRFYEGVLLGGLERSEEAVETLLKADDDRGYVLAARLIRRNRGDYAAAYDAISRVRCEVLALHPEVVCERDLILEGMGPERLAEREAWMARTAGLADEWLIERRASVLIAKKEFQAAKALLESTPFQLVHQRYVRLPLWEQAQEGLGLPLDHPLNWMGEDTLAAFGKYQEYEGE